MINISLTDHVTPLLNTLEHDLNDLRPALTEIGEFVVESVHQNFDEEGRPEAWEPRQDDNPWPILHHTGDLYRSIYYDVIGTEVTVDEGTGYGVYHDGGTSTIPQRQFLLIQPEDESEIENIIWSHFDYL